MPVLPLIVTVPLLVAKSPALDTAQFNTVPFVTLVVVTVNVIATPSLTDVGVVDTRYVGTGGARLVSLIVIAGLVVTTGVPVILPVRTVTVNVSAPSVAVSARGVTLNEPVFPVMVKLPLVTPKSPELVPIVQ